MIYGLLLILFIIYMPKGILGTLLEWREKKETRAGGPNFVLTPHLILRSVA